LAHVAELLGLLQQADLVADNLLILRHRGLLQSPSPGRAIPPRPANLQPTFGRLHGWRQQMA
jgi:hypothetical protein